MDLKSQTENGERAQAEGYTPPQGEAEARGGAAPDGTGGPQSNLPSRTTPPLRIWGGPQDSAKPPTAKQKARPKVRSTAAGRSKGGSVSKLRKREKDIAVREFLALEVKKEVDLILRVFKEGMEAETVVYQAGRAESRPDHKTRIAAASSLLAEAFGRPANVLVGKDGGRWSSRMWMWRVEGGAAGRWMIWRSGGEEAGSCSVRRAVEWVEVLRKQGLAVPNGETFQSLADDLAFGGGSSPLGIMMGAEGLIRRRSGGRVGGTSGASTVSGTLRAGLVGLPAGAIVTNVNYIVTGGGAAVTLLRVGIYSSAASPVLLASSGTSRRRGRRGRRWCRSLSPGWCRCTAAYYVALLVVASGTAPTLVKGVNLAGANVAIGSGPRPCFDQTGQSDLPATATPAGRGHRVLVRAQLR